MRDRIDGLASVLFNKPSLHDCSLEQVEYLVHQYPYFGAAQLLLLQKTEKGSAAYAQQLQRTALHFSNPLQLYFWLEPDEVEIENHPSQLFQNPMPVEAEGPELNEEVEAIKEQHSIATNQTAEVPLPVAEPVAQNSEQIHVPQSEPPETTAAEPVTETTDAPEKASAESKPSSEATAITFEPYHTVDYFASQGIKLSQQEATADRLGKQLKSFTEWLKTMKRLPETVSPPTDPVVERNVENLAAHSLDTAEVVTESMAEVWLKQGDTEKAAEIYNKLRLRHPDKSAYFAAKIEALKQS